MRNTASVVAVVATLAVALTACTPGASNNAGPAEVGPVSKDVSAAGDVTLTVWDQNVDPGIAEAQDELNKKFEDMYPNVTIERTARSFDDLKKTLRLALTSNTPPDVAQVNQGYPDMGAFVGAGLLRPLNDYKDLYGWGDYYPEALLKQNSFSADGKTWQGDDLFGISQTGELVGVYYNPALLDQLGVKAPTNLEDLESAMAAAKSAGILPLAFGNLEKSPGIHLFGVTQAALAGAEAVVELVSSQGGSWTDEANVEAATKIARWAADGYLTAGANGVSRDDAISAFGRGEALFLISGTWQQAKLEEAMGPSGAGFTALNSRVDGEPATTGGQGLAWSIGAKTEHPDVAAAYLDFVTNAQAAELLMTTGALSTVLPENYQPKAGTLAADIAEQYRAVQAANGVVPYLDYATTTFFDTLTAGAQDLIAGQSTPEQFLQKLQADQDAFLAGR